MIHSGAITLSGTTVTLTGIPVDAKQISLDLFGVTHANDGLRIRLGTTPAGIATVGYDSHFQQIRLTQAHLGSLIGFDMPTINYFPYSIHVTLTLANAATNAWICTYRGGSRTIGVNFNLYGRVSLPAILDRIQLSLVGGNSFTGGKVSYLAGSGPVTALADPYTVLLLHCDGTNGSTVVPDSSPAAHGFATVAGPVGVSTAVAPKFGAGSLINGSNGYYTFTNSDDWNFYAGDFTIDWWEYRTGGGCAIARDLPNTYSAFLLSYGATRSIYMSSSGSAWDVASRASPFGTVTNGVWTHLAITRQGSTFRAFKDGVQTDTWTSALSLMTSLYPLCIGAAQSGQNFGGYMDEVRISKGIARWTANFTPPTMPYNTDATAYASKLLMHMDGANASVVFPDSSMWARGNATVKGNAQVTTAQGKFSQSAAFDGAGDGLQYPAHADWDFGSGEFTVDFFLRLNALPTAGIVWAAVVAHLASGTDLNNRWWVAIHSSGGVAFDQYNTPGPTATISIMGGTMPLNTWKHVAVVRSGAVVTIYLDGAAVVSGTPTGAFPAISGPLNIGIADVANNYPLNGQIDELRVAKGLARWTANFTPPTAPDEPAASTGIQIEYPTTYKTKVLLHLDNNLTDAASGVGINGTHTFTMRGAAHATTGQKFGSACLDCRGNGGADSPAQADYQVGSGDWTLDFWMKFPSFVEGQADYYALAFGGIMAQSYAVWFDTSSPARLMFRVTSDGSTEIVSNAFATVNMMSQGFWTHVAITRASNVWRWFLDGNLISSATSGTAVHQSVQALGIGCLPAGNNSWIGQIDEVRITKGQALWTANFTPPTAAGVVQ